MSKELTAGAVQLRSANKKAELDSDAGGAYDDEFSSDGRAPMIEGAEGAPSDSNGVSEDSAATLLYKSG